MGKREGKALRSCQDAGQIGTFPPFQSRPSMFYLSLRTNRFELQHLWAKNSASRRAPWRWKRYPPHRHAVAASGLGADAGEAAPVRAAIHARPAARRLGPRGGHFRLRQIRQPWLDWCSGVLVTNAGHGAPEVRQAIIDQVNSGLLHNYVFPSEERAELAE